MGDKSKIEWTSATWNPWQGCHKVSAGCTHCYMFRDKERYGQNPNVVVRSRPRTFNLPLRLKEPQRVFTCSWSDFFIEEADPWRDEAWDIIRRTPHLTYQILTKRIERATGRLPWKSWEDPWPNVWLVVSVEDQESADDRIPILLTLNAAVHGVSYEPALDAVDFSPYLKVSFACPNCGDGSGYLGELCSCGQGVYMEQPRVDWIIIGGESGQRARAFDLAWARQTIEQCRAEGVPLFVKQLGARTIDSDYKSGTFAPEDHRSVSAMKAVKIDHVGFNLMLLKDHKGANIDEWPAELKVREFPATGETAR